MPRPRPRRDRLRRHLRARGRLHDVSSATSSRARGRRRRPPPAPPRGRAVDRHHRGRGTADLAAAWTPPHGAASPAGARGLMPTPPLVLRGGERAVAAAHNDTDAGVARARASPRLVDVPRARGHLRGARVLDTRSPDPRGCSSAPSMMSQLALCLFAVFIGSRGEARLRPHGQRRSRARSRALPDLAVLRGTAGARRDCQKAIGAGAAAAAPPPATGAAAPASTPEAPASLKSSRRVTARARARGDGARLLSMARCRRCAHLRGTQKRRSHSYEWNITGRAGPVGAVKAPCDFLVANLLTRGLRCDCGYPLSVSTTFGTGTSQ